MEGKGPSDGIRSVLFVNEMLLDLWSEAHAVLGLSPSRTRLFVAPGSPPPAAPQLALHVSPFGSAVATPTPFSPKLKQEMDHPTLWSIHRIAIFDGVGDLQISPEIHFALMVHELRHAVQWEFNSLVYIAGTLVDDAIRRAYAGTGRGGTSIGRLAPHEADADAAASAASRSRFDEIPRAALEGPYASLFLCAEQLQDVARLGPKLLAFASLQSGAFEAACYASQRSVDSILKSLVISGGPSIWARLRTDDVVREHHRRVGELIPDAGAIAQAGARPQDAWRTVRDDIVHTYRYALDRVDGWMHAIARA